MSVTSNRLRPYKFNRSECTDCKPRPTVDPVEPRGRTRRVDGHPLGQKNVPLESLSGLRLCKYFGDEHSLNDYRATGLLQFPVHVSSTSSSECDENYLPSSPFLEHF